MDMANSASLLLACLLYHIRRENNQSLIIYFSVLFPSFSGYSAVGVVIFPRSEHSEPVKIARFYLLIFCFMMLARLGSMVKMEASFEYRQTG